MGRAQVSIEYLVIVGVAIGLLIPAVMFFYAYNSSGKSQSVGAQVNEIGLQASGMAKSTYALGKNARQTLEFTMPESVRRVYVSGSDMRELVVAYDTQAGRSEAVFFSTIPLATAYADGNVSTAHPGLTKYQFESLGDTVRVTESVS